MKKGTKKAQVKRGIKTKLREKKNKRVKLFKRLSKLKKLLFKKFK